MRKAHFRIDDPTQPPGADRVRVAIYTRVSASDDRQEVENQLSDLRQFAERQGWDVAHEYIDYESGNKSTRTEFRRIFADAAQRRFDLTLVWALDRFTRESVAETFENIQRLTS